MPAISSSPTRPGAPAAGGWGAPIAASAGVLELVGSEQPELLDFTAHVLANSTMSFALENLAAELEVAPDRLGWTVERACRDLDRLERHRGRWRDPARVLGKPNLAALRFVCHFRLQRVPVVKRRLRLQRIQRKLERAWQLARTRAWIDDFLSEPGEPARKEARDADR